MAKGTSYRVAAEIARQKTGRVPAGMRSRRSPANEGQLVANWVSTAIVCGQRSGQLPGTDELAAHIDWLQKFAQIDG